ncbi:transposase [Streptomyces sp. UH6]|uniref:transposase n=1 Tax=Streptomyces sp. UH6 TaxID=2748379 RepID=UPI0015D522B4|nr:transposase [Streptomyces sp. UH6]NYV72898.1 transposase [Streptomyces sp. UH6]
MHSVILDAGAVPHHPIPPDIANRLCLQGILYVLHNEIAWQRLPFELGFGSGRTCWRRLER